MKTKWIRLTMVLISTLFILSACSTPAALSDHDLMADVVAAERPENPDPPSDEYLDAVSDFSMKLLQASLNNPGNILVSPASVFFALSMTLNGADGETRQAMMNALSASGLTEEQLNEASRDWMTLLEDTGENTELYLTNSIWVREQYPVHPDFLKRNADFYRADAYSLDFSLPEAVSKINGWVKKATREKIDSIVDQIDSDVMMYLVNALYFKSDWETTFEAEATYDGVFHAPGQDMTVSYMNRQGNMTYFKTEEAKGIWLPYTDDAFAFFALMPENGSDLRNWISEYDAEALLGLLDQRQSGPVDLTLPKFEIEYENSLIDELEQLGMGIAFSGKADFSRMNADDISDLFISEVKHKTYCRVDEKGTEAAAVTSVEMKLTALPESDIELVFDRPFLFGIVDTRTNSPLFVGVIEKPEA